MSRISTLEGRAVYETEEKRDNVFDTLRSNGWDSYDIIAEQIKTDEGEQPAIIIRYGVYRNLGRNLELLTNTASDWAFIETVTDGVFKGYVNTTDISKEDDLEVWAEHEHVDPVPEKSDFDSEDDWFDEYTDWQSDVESQYNAVMKQELLDEETLLPDFPQPEEAAD